MRFDCRKCPIYRLCVQAHRYVLAGAPVEVVGISSYEECELFNACGNGYERGDHDKILKCLIFEIEDQLLFSD